MACLRPTGPRPQPWYFRLSQELEDWKIGLSGTAAAISGLAADAAARKAAEQRLKDWAAQGGFALTLKLATGPRLLPYETVAGILTKAADCGALTQSGAAQEPYPLGAAIEIGGKHIGRGGGGADRGATARPRSGTAACGSI